MPLNLGHSPVLYDQSKAQSMATVLIGGGSGLIGARLSHLLREKGYEVWHLSRKPRPDAAYQAFQWDPAAGSIDEEAVQQADFIINLAGAGIADKPWTKARKQLIIDSRVEGTRLLRQAMEKAAVPPKAFIWSSAIGYYGNRGEALLREDAPPGQGFLSQSTMAWEEAIREVGQIGVRTVGLRTGIVLSTKGGALPKMMMPFSFYVAPYFGNGQQWYSWVHIDDICRLYIFAIENSGMSGFYNGTAPNPVTNKGLVERLKEVLRSPALLAPAPTFALRLALGEMADAILESTRTSADKVLSAGFHFEFPNVGEALKDVIQKGK